jgi:hypothetical protein
MFCSSLLRIKFWSKLDFKVEKKSFSQENNSYNGIRLKQFDHFKSYVKS